MVTEGRSRPYARLRSLRKQEGAAALYGLVTAVSSLAATALAVDIGQLYYAQRDLQKMASDAALEAARAQSGCYNIDGRPGLIGAAQTAVDTALTRDLPFAMKDGAGALPTLPMVKQDYQFGVATVEYGMVGMANDNAGTRTRAFTALDPNSPAVDSVRVNLARPSPTLLVPFITLGGTAPSPAGTVLLRASAAAQQSPVVSYKIGNQIANLSLPLICGLIASTPGTGPVPSQSASACAKINVGSQKDLADATVTLNGIATAMGIDNAGKLLTTNLPEKQYLQGIADALAATGQTAAAMTFQTLAGFADPNKTVLPIDPLGVESMADNQIGSLPLNAVELLNSVALAANATYPIALPVTIGGPSLPGITGSVFLALGDTSSGLSNSDRKGPAQRNAAGRAGFDQNGNPRTYANMQQLKLLVRLNIDSSKALAAIPAISTLAATQINLGIDITAASAATFLSGIHCPSVIGSSASQPKVDINATVSDATVTIGGFDAKSPSSPVIPGAASLVAVTAGSSMLKAGLTVDTSSSVKTSVQPFSGNHTFTGPFDSPDNSVYTIGATDLQTNAIVAGLLSSLGSNLTVKLVLPVPVPTLPVSVPGLGNTVTTIPASLVVDQLQGPISTVLSTAVDPVLSSLGAGLNGTTITVLAYQPGTNASIVSTATPVLFTRAKPGIEVAPNPTVEPIQN